MRRLLKLVLGFLVVSSVIWGVGQAVTRSRSSDDLADDELDVYTFWMGKEAIATSQALRRVTARVLMGGATIDLRQAQPAPEGLVVDVGTMMGGTALLVRKDWNVNVDEQSENAQVEIRLDDGAEAASDAPVVDVVLKTKYGGALVGYELPEQMKMKAAG